MQILVKYVLGNDFILEIENWDTVRDLKEKICDVERYPPEEQQLIFGGIKLWDDDVFYERYLILSGKNKDHESSESSDIPTVYMLLRLRGGGNVVYPRSAKMQRSSSSSSESDHEYSDPDDDSSYYPPKAYDLHLFRSHALSVPLFDGTNFSDWNEQFRSHLRDLDIDLALEIERPITITKSSSSKERKSYKAWKRSNVLSMKFALITIASKIKRILPQPKNAKEFMNTIEERFHQNNEFLIRKLLEDLTTKKISDASRIHKHVLAMRVIAKKLMELGVTVDEHFLVQLILNSLPPQYKRFQGHYSNIKDNWDLNELHYTLLEEEARLEQEEEPLKSGLGHNLQRTHRS